MTFDLSKFASEIGLAPEDKAALDALFTKYPTAPTTLETAMTREVEARLDPLKKALETKQQEVDAQFDTLSSIRGGDAEAIAKAEKRAETLASEAAILRSRIQRIGTESGIDVEPYLKDLAEPTKPVVETPPTIDLDKILRHANTMALTSLENSMLADDLADEHQALFGSRLSRVELMNKLKETVKRTGNQNLGLRDVWESAYGVAAKREELTKADVQRQIQEAVKKRETELRDELALRGTTSEVSTFSGSPALAVLMKDSKPATVNGVNESVAAAMTEFRRARSERLAKAS